MQSRQDRRQRTRTVGVALLVDTEHLQLGEPNLKDWAGQMVEVNGELAERNGVKVLTVTGSKAAG